MTTDQINESENVLEPTNTLKVESYFTADDHNEIKKIKEEEKSDLPNFFVRDVDATDENGEICESKLFEEKKKKGKYQKPLYYTQKQFDKVKESNKVLILGDIELSKKHKKGKEDKQAKDDKFLGILNLKYDENYKSEKKIDATFAQFDIKKNKKNNPKGKGYFYVGDDTYVRIKKNSVFLTVLVFIMIAAITFGVLFALLPEVRTETKKLLGIENAQQYDGEDTNGTKAYTDETEIPGFTSAAISSQKRYLKLHNPTGNTVYFKYTLYLDDNTDNKADDLNKDGKTDDKDAIFSTQLIEPGKMVKCDIYSILKGYKGTKHTVYMQISCYDLETQDVCNGATQNVTYTLS